MTTNRILTSSCFLLSALAVGGCALSKDLVSSGTVKAETAGTAALVVTRPKVYQADGMVHVVGDVRRPGFSPMTGTGHVHVRLVDAAGESLRSATARFATPAGRKTPRTPNPRVASYHAVLPGFVPDGGTVRVALCSEPQSSGEAQE